MGILTSFYIVLVLSFIPEASLDFFVRGERGDFFSNVTNVHRVGKIFLLGNVDFFFFSSIDSRSAEYFMSRIFLKLYFVLCYRYQ